MTRTIFSRHGLAALVLLALLAPPVGAWAQANLMPGDSVGAVSEDLGPGETGFGPICREVRKVDVRVAEPVANFIDLTEARARAGKRARELGLNAIVGIEVSGSASSYGEVVNGRASARYVEESEMTRAGLLRTVLVEEVIAPDGAGGLVTQRVEVTVCLPKTPEEIAEDARRARPPAPVTSTNPEFFNPATGAPRIWYAKDPDGTIRLYDNAGFDPETGSALSPVSAPVISARQVQSQARAAQSREQARAREDCDRYAANPEDRQKPRSVPRVAYRILADNADAAIRACELALEREPANARFAYQLGRAWQTRDGARALPYLRRATQAGYLAAYDNIGWIFIRQDRLGEARQMFRQGAELGDPSAMFSLGSLLDQPGDPASQQMAVQWYRRAADLGHGGAQARLEELQIELAEAERQARQADEAARRKAQQDAQALQLMLGILGAVTQR